MSSTRVGPRRVWHASLAFGVAVIVAACAGVSEVSPDEIPSLAQQVERDPSNGEVVARYAAALYAADRCDSAMTVARSAQQLRPDVALGSLVLGQCYEQAEQFDSAIGVYEAFLTAHGDARGSAAIQARVMLAQRENSRRVARQAIQ